MKDRETINLTEEEVNFLKEKSVELFAQLLWKNTYPHAPVPKLEKTEDSSGAHSLIFNSPGTIESEPLLQSIKNKILASYDLQRQKITALTFHKHPYENGSYEAHGNGVTYTLREIEPLAGEFSDGPLYDAFRYSETPKIKDDVLLNGKKFDFKSIELATAKNLCQKDYDKVLKKLLNEIEKDKT